MLSVRRHFCAWGISALLAAGCASSSRPRAASPESRTPGQASTTSASPGSGVEDSSEEKQAALPAPPPPADPRATFAAWLKERLPEGGEIVDRAGAPLALVHTARKGDTFLSVAKAYLDLTDVYFSEDLAKEMVKAAPKEKRGVLAEGTRVDIPRVLPEPYKTGDAERLELPADKAVRGLYMRGDTAARSFFLGMIDKMAPRGINAIVLDAKDYDGPITYPSKVAVALESGSVKNPPIRDLARTIRFVHKRGVRVLIRISCFEDEIVAKAKPKLSVQAKWGRAYPIGWLDPNNEEAQQYVIDLAKEAMDAGADEIQLDYVRYPVLGIKGADFKLDPNNPIAKVDVITGFVHKVHEITHARGVPLSLDIFGVVAHGNRVDIDALGQDPARLAPECEALSPMVYPSHYSTGFYGFEVPGDHPEIIGIGTRLTIEQLRKANQSVTQVRPWLQAMNYKSPSYGPLYLAQEVKYAGENGAAGWLMWNPGQDYDYAWRAVPVAAK
jgi:hypothetical protein